MAYPQTIELSHTRGLSPCVQSKAHKANVIWVRGASIGNRRHWLAFRVAEMLPPGANIAYLFEGIYRVYTHVILGSGASSVGWSRPP